MHEEKNINNNIVWKNVKIILLQGMEVEKYGKSA